VVDRVTRLRSGNRDNIVRLSAVARDFSLPQSVQSGTVAQQSPTHGVPEALSREILGSDREFNHLHLWNYNLTPMYNRGVHDGDFTFHLMFNDPCR
jgi:hypothetical protein